MMRKAKGKVRDESRIDRDPLPYRRFGCPLTTDFSVSSGMRTGGLNVFPRSDKIKISLSETSGRRDPGSSSTLGMRAVRVQGDLPNRA